MFRIFRIVALLVPVFLGGLIYIVFRTEKLIMFRWFYYLNLTDEVNFAKSFKSILTFPDWFIYSLPDGLWMFSYTAILLEIWKSSINQYSLLWILSIPIAALLSEFLQLFIIVPGTFDYADIISYLMGITLPFLLTKNLILKKK